MEKAYLLNISFGNSNTTTEDDLIELKELARTAGAKAIGSSKQNRLKPDPATFLGKGKLNSIINLNDHNNFIFKGIE